MDLYTIGFTRKTAQRFFALLEAASVARIVDVRLNNVSQLAGFAKREDLAFFAHALAGIDYVHCTELAPTPAMLAHYRGSAGRWDDYEREFRALLAQREVERTLPRELFDRACLLCSEASPHHCHRRVVADYLNEHWGNLRIAHLT